jgi:hypothetical protein
MNNVGLRTKDRSSMQSGMRLASAKEVKECFAFPVVAWDDMFWLEAQSVPGEDRM